MAAVAYRRFLFRWGALIAVVPLLLLLFAWDRSLKTSGRAVFCPPSPEWTVASDDIGRFWRAVEQHDALRAIDREVPRPFHGIEYYVYTSTGIRPTAGRWSLWMGGHFLAARSREGVGICTRPGLLMRAATAVHGVFGGAADGGGVYAFGIHFYAWRDGALIVSRSRDYVVAALAAPEPGLEPAAGAIEARFQRHLAPRCLVRVEPAGAFPVSGWVDIAIQTGDSPIAVVNRVSGRSLCALGIRKASDAASLWETAVSIMPIPEWDYSSAEQVSSIVAQWDVYAAWQQLNSAADEAAYAILDIGTNNGLPIPVAASLHRVGDAIESETRSSSPHAIPYEWDGRDGMIEPVIGEAVTLAVCWDDGVVLAASQTQAMDALLAEPVETAGRDCDVYVEWNWKRVSNSAESILKWLGAGGLVPGMNADDVDHVLIPAAKSVESLGTMELMGKMNAGRLEIQGSLMLRALDAGNATPAGSP